MTLVYTIVDLPPVWPGKKTDVKKKTPLKTQWTRTIHILERELKHLDAQKVEFALKVNYGDVREDGQLRASARPGPPVIVSFVDGEGNRQSYPCDTFGWWEDLRRAERYGVQSALLRAGFKALPSTTSATMTAEWAAALLLRYGTTTMDPAHVLGNKENAKLVYREAKARTHPDTPLGSTETFKLVEDARAVIEQHFGSKL